MQLRSFRRGQSAGHPAAVDSSLDGPDQAGLAAGSGNRSFEQVRRRGLARCAGNTDDLHLLRGPAVDFRGDLTEHIPRVRMNENWDGPVRRLVRGLDQFEAGLVGQDRGRTTPQSVDGELSAMGPCTGQSGEEVIGHDSLRTQVDALDDDLRGL